jgi:uncharacterized membrane protein
MASALLGGILLGMVVKRLSSWQGWSVAALGGALLHRGVTGRCEAYRALDINTHEADVEGVHIHAAVTVNRSPEELYRYWRHLENLPRIMSHLESVKEQGEKYSHWVAKAPAGRTVAWEAEIVSETENHSIFWRSREGSQITNAGSVRFVPAGDRGTEVHISLSYSPPAGTVGMAIAKMFGEEPHLQIQDDLLHFKQFMEAGEIATTEGQPAGQSAKRQMKALALSSARSRTETAQENGKTNGNGKHNESLPEPYGLESLRLEGGEV